MSEKSEICQLVVTNDRKFGDVEYQFLFQAVDGKVRLGCNVRTCVAGKAKLKVAAPVTLTIEKAREFAHELAYMASEAREQEEKNK